jgi:hypothetical protein
MSSSTASSSTTQPGAGINSNASVAPQQQQQRGGPGKNDTILVDGQKGDSVTVQSQLATSNVAGDVTSRSNIGQVVSATHKSLPR